MTTQVYRIEVRGKNKTEICACLTWDSLECLGGHIGPHNTRMKSNKFEARVWGQIQGPADGHCIPQATIQGKERQTKFYHQLE
jgi:hypothetical protein